MRNKIGFTILFVLTLALVFIARKNQFDDKADLYLHETTERTQSEYQAMVESYKLMTQTFLSEVIIQPEILRIYKDAHQADSAQQQLIRDQLLAKLQSNYAFLKEHNVRQLHFHLPDNTSFLRFHRPGKFGDDLSDIRYSVKMTNLKKKPYFGFEEGRIFNGFRNVYPLFWEDVHLGSVEISFSFDAMKNYSASDSSTVFELLLSEKLVDSKVFKDERGSYANSPILDGYVYEMEFHKHVDHYKELIKSLDRSRTKINSLTASKAHFTMPFNSNNEHFTVTFINIKNVEKQSVGYLFSFKKNHKLAEIKAQFLTSIIISFTVVLIIFLLMFYLYEKKLTMKEKDRKLLASEKKYQSIINRMSDVYFRMDMDHNLIMMSPSGVRQLQYSHQGQMIGKNVPDNFYMVPADYNDFLQELEQQNGVVSNFEVLLKNSSGEPVSFETNSQYTYDQEGNIDGVEGILRNISDQKEAQQKIQEYTHELEEANRTKDTFFSIIAHDLKNPFMAILGLTELLKLNAEQYSRNEIQDMIELIDSSAKNTFKLLEQLLDWSRIQSGRIKFEPDHHEVDALISGVFNYYKSAADHKEITLSKSIETYFEPATLYCDSNLMSTIIRNLVSNAIKFTPEGGEITVDVQQNSIETTFIVSDTGVGISKDIRKKLFRIEEKISTNGTNNEMGTGLGLLLCKEFTEKHQGTIEVHSTIGKGTRFTVVIPQSFMEQKPTEDLVEEEPLPV